MAFIESPRFPDNLRFGFAGGPEFSTDIAVLGSGFEQRNQNWLQAKGRWQGEHGPHKRAETDELIAFVRAAGGAANGFRFKDWTDFLCAISDGVIGAGVGTGYPTLQLNKIYSAGATSSSRQIRKPVSATIEVYKNSTKMTSGYSLDSATGMVNFTATSTKSVNANSAKTITGITKANPGIVTAVGHGFVTGDKIKITGVGGMIEVNNLYFTITWISADTFSIGANTTAYTTYTSGGTATKYGITQTSPARIHSTAHGFTNGQIVYISGCAGMIEVNGIAFTVSGTSADYFEISGINATSYAAYTGSGTIGIYPQPADTLTWLGEFDVAARFISDSLSISIVDYELFAWNNVEIVEIRT